MKLIVFKFFVQFLIVLSAIIFVVQIKAQNQQDGKTEVESVITAKGELQLIKHFTDNYVEQISVRFRDKVLLEAPYQYINVRGNFGKQPKNLFLVFLGTDALTCTGKFVIVDLSGNSPKVTQEFGNCSDAPKITSVNNSLTLNFPDGTKSKSKYSIGRREVWQYKSGKLKKLKSS